MRKWLRSINLEQKSVNVLCKGSDTKYFWLGSHMVSVARTKAAVDNKYVGVGVFQ